MRALVTGIGILLVGVVAGAAVGFGVELATRAAGWTMVLALAGLIAAALYLALGAPEDPAELAGAEAPDAAPPRAPEGSADTHALQRA
jgi:hypothetical protein